MPQRSFSAKSPPKKCRNRERRAREYLTPTEVDHLIRAARQRGRYGHRDATLLLLMYRHGLRVAEAVHLRWEMLDLKAAVLHVQRVKHGVAAVHPLRGAELRALRQLQQTHGGMAYLFVSERGGPLTTRAVHY
jgi:integrase